MKQRKQGNLICSRYWSEKYPVFYVAQVPGDGGVDWGYTDKRDEAIKLNKYFAARFSADCKRVGTAARIQESA